MTDRFSEPDDDLEMEELDEDGNQLSRLTPQAREWLAHARAQLVRPTDGRRS